MLSEMTELGAEDVGLKTSEAVKADPVQHATPPTPQRFEPDAVESLSPIAKFVVLCRSTTPEPVTAGIQPLSLKA